MTTQYKIIWTLTALIVAITAIIVMTRSTDDTGNGDGTNANMSAADKESLVENMLELLEKDPRARLRATQESVGLVAQLAQSGELDTAETQYALGLMLHYAQGNNEAALEAYQRAVSMKSEWSRAHNSMAILLHNMGRQDESVAEFEKAIECDPSWSRPHSDLAILHRTDGNLKDAEREARIALDLESDGAGTHNNYGVLLHIAGKEAEAKREFRKAIELDETLPTPYYNLACSFAVQGNAVKAVEQLIKSIELDPAFRDAAKDDSDFDKIRDNPKFQQVLAE